MTVANRSAMNTQKFVCHWFVDSKLEKGEFYPHELKKVDESKQPTSSTGGGSRGDRTGI